MRRALTILILSIILFGCSESPSADRAAIDTAKYTLWLFVATALLTFVTGVLAWVAWVQISAGQEQRRKWATLNACDRWDTDGYIRSANSALKKSFGAVAPNRLDVRDADYLITIFNYFDSIAIGAEQGFYEKAIIVPHLGNIMQQAMLRRQQWPLEFENTFENDFQSFSRFYKTHVEMKPQLSQ